jgi:hypothetical protein
MSTDICSERAIILRLPGSNRRALRRACAKIGARLRENSELRNRFNEVAFCATCAEILKTMIG